MSQNEELWAHCGNKGGNEAEQFVPVVGMVGAHCASKWVGYRPTVTLNGELRVQV